MASFSPSGRREPVLSVEPSSDGGMWCVRVLGLEKHHDVLRSPNSPPLLRVRVARDFDADELPDVSGSLEARDDEVRFVPDFPFRPGLLFRAILDLRGQEGGVVTHDFSLSEQEIVERARVALVYPSLDVLPENLLRFTVQFSAPMRRGCAERHVHLLDMDGNPVPDALYRAPVELWDRSMTCLTVLLDPGRLKRGVGPNRMLGAPLQAGGRYTLMIEPGMIDAQGRRLEEGFSKPFRVAEAVREPIAIESWSMRWPAAGSRDALELTFPWPLDRVQLRHGIVVTSRSGQPVDGTADVDQEERRWRFTPDRSWTPGTYECRVSPTLEDICGNTVSGPFDGPLRSAEDAMQETAVRSLRFVL